MNHVVPGITGIIDDDVQTAETFDRGIDQFFTQIPPDHVACTGKGFSTRVIYCFDNLVRWLCVEVIDYYSCACASQFVRNSLADTTAGTGYERYFSFQYFHILAPHLLIGSGHSGLNKKQCQGNEQPTRDLVE